MNACKNCGAPIPARFCSECGQKDLELERPLPALLKEVVREAFDVDGAIARTLWTLLRYPGVLTAEFLAGRRRRYVSPLRLYIAIGVLFFVLAAWLAARGTLLNDGQTLEADAAGQAELLADYVPRLMVLLLPVFALLLKVLFWRRFYFDHLIHALHLHSLTYLALALMLPLEKLADEYVAVMLVQVSLFIYLLVSFVASIRHVYQTSWLAAAAKGLLIVLAYMALVAGTFEAVTYLLSSGESAQPFLTD